MAVEAHDVSAEAILSAMAAGRWMTTTDVAELVMPDGLRSRPRPVWTAYRGDVVAMMHALANDGLVEKRVVADPSPDAFRRPGAEAPTRLEWRRR